MKNKLIFLGCVLAALLKAQQTSNISFKHVDKVINACFTTPAGSGPFETIVLVPGSGANDRDGTLLLAGGNAACLYPNLVNQTLKSYKQLGDALADSGYAVLRYDKIEYTYPSNPGTITFTKLWLPVESAIKYLKTRADVDTANIILIGHSEGSALIPYVAKDRKDIRALISLAGARTPFDSVFARQLVEFTQQCGGNVTQAQADANTMLNYAGVIRNNQWNSSTPPLFGVPAAVWSDYFQATDPVATHYNQAKLPTLFLGMALDYNVPPSELLRFQSEVNITEDFWSLPGLNHYMTPNDDPYIHPAVADTIVYWLRKQKILTGLRSREAQTGLKIYPSPVVSDLLISYEAGFNSMDVSITDILGKKIHSEHFRNNSINRVDISSAPAGVYFVTIHADGKTATRKIVKN